MIVGTSALDLFGNRMPNQRALFDITLLPMNLSEGRNIGDLSGLFLFQAPKKAENSRLSDIFIVLFSVENMQIPEPRMKTWANILAETYYKARGSFTMGMSEAVKKLSAYLEKENAGQILPTVYMNAAVLRDRTLMIAHAGPVHSTVISYDKVQNFCDEACLPIQLRNNQLSFFQTEVHSEDIILLCPHVPADWTNTAIMEVTGDSPLNAIRFLLDRSGGNLQAAVIQLKSGKGQISFRSKTVITANVQPEKIEPEPKTDSRSRRKYTDPLSTYDPDDLPNDRPLMRTRKSSEWFDSVNNLENADKSTEVQAEETENTLPDESDENLSDESQSASLTGENELPGSQDLPYDFTEEQKKESRKSSASKDRKKAGKNPQNNQKSTKKKQEKGKFNGKRFFLILLCGLLIPVIVISVLFFVYSGRSNDQLHREYLELAVASAQRALNESKVQTREALWVETINYSEQALGYGNSPAANDLKREAVNEIDRINGGISTVYNYANQSKLPQGLNITEISSSGQYTYGLDSTSGSVLRFVSSGNGYAMDSSFTCAPGTYKGVNDEDPSVQVGALIDFIILPNGSPHGFVIAGIDADANMLYCSGFSESKAAALKKPDEGRFAVSNITFANNAMYVLDRKSSAVWEFLYSNSDGFIYEPSNYYGSYSPFLSDVIDFAMYKEFSFFLRENGTLLTCDYTGYRPDCRSITEIDSEDGSAHIGLANHQFRKILVNNSPDNSVYIMDAKMQSILNLSVRGNFVRYIIPNRTLEEISHYSEATGFGITGQNRLLWAYKNDFYAGNMP